MNTLSEQLKQLRLANDSYARGNPFLTDEEYHILWRSIRELDPTNLELYHTSRDPNRVNVVPHLVPLFSPMKAFESAELKPFLHRFKDTPLIIQPKYDGIAAVIYNLGGGACKLVKSGDGYSGEDITHHLPGIHMPKGWQDRAYTGVELIIPNVVWSPLWGKNQRNTVAGWLNRSKPLDQVLIVAIPHEDHFVYLNIYPPYDLADLEDTLLHRYSDWSVIYPIDGLMIKVADPTLRLQASHNGTTLLWSIAWKPPISTKWTTVEEIQWNVSRSGRVVPKVRYKPITLCGTENQYATGNNARWVELKGITPGVEILIGKAGEIIPKIMDVRVTKDAPSPLPTQCPVCGSYLEESGVDLLCVAANCIARMTKRIAYFYSDKGMEIKSIGEAMITQLLQDEVCRQTLWSVPWALLEPDTYNLYARIESIWGTARSETYLDSLADLNNSKNPAHFVAALGYKNLAYKTALACFQAFLGYSNPKRSIQNSVDNFAIALRDFTTAMETMKHFQLQEIPKPAKVTYCITGTLSIPRSDMIDYLAFYGWQPTNQVSKFTNILLLGELNKVSTKLKKAKDLGVTIISEDQLPAMLEQQEEKTNEPESNNKVNSRG